MKKNGVVTYIRYVQKQTVTRGISDDRNTSARIRLQQRYQAQTQHQSNLPQQGEVVQQQATAAVVNHEQQLSELIDSVKRIDQSMIEINNDIKTTLSNKSAVEKTIVALKAAISQRHVSQRCTETTSECSLSLHAYSVLLISEFRVINLKNRLSEFTQQRQTLNARILAIQPTHCESNIPTLAPEDMSHNPEKPSDYLKMIENETIKLQTMKDMDNDAAEVRDKITESITYLKETRQYRLKETRQYRSDIDTHIADPDQIEAAIVKLENILQTIVPQTTVEVVVATSTALDTLSI